MGVRYFNKDIAPCCDYCGHGRLGHDKSVVLCPKRGVMSPKDSCKKFLYDPLKRTPRAAPELPEYDEEDFSL